MRQLSQRYEILNERGFYICAVLNTEQRGNGETGRPKYYFKCSLKNMRYNFLKTSTHTIASHLIQFMFCQFQIFQKIPYLTNSVFHADFHDVLRLNAPTEPSKTVVPVTAVG
jgi:hypothetical protein